MKKVILISGFFILLVACAHTAKLDINIASEGELEALKSVRPRQAHAIVEYRNKYGNFKSVDELDKVPGFGKKTVDALKDYLTVGN